MSDKNPKITMRAVKPSHLALVSGFFFITSFYTIYNGNVNMDHHTNIPQQSSILLDEHLQKVKFFIYHNYSDSIKSYFSKCNVSGDKSNQKWKNRYSHLGETYFDYNSLKNHKWVTNNIFEADIIVSPIFLTLSYHNFCPGGFFSKNIRDFFKQLREFDRTVIKRNGIKAKYLLIVSDPYTSKVQKPLSMMQFVEDHKNNLIIGHFATVLMFGQVPQRINTVVIPYTIPFDFDSYQMYEDTHYSINDFHQRKYTLFYMGSACKGIRHKNRWTMKYRALGIQHILTLNREENNNLTNFGIVTDYSDSIDSPCVVQSGLNVNEVKRCTQQSVSDHYPWPVDVLPCGLDRSNKHKINANNEVYLHGLRNSKYALMMRGDMPSSAKFYDSIAFNQINILVGITRENMDGFLPFTDIVPYENFVFFISPQEFEQNGLEYLKDIIYNTPKSTLDLMIANMTFYKKYFLFGHRHSLVVDNILLETKQMS